MYIHNINPTLLQLGPLEIRWYGLVYVFGFLVTAYWLNKYKTQVNLTKEQVWDLLFYIIVGLLIGARVFMIFWQPKIYLLNPLNLFKIWQGGMSFHGGLIGSILGTLLYTKKNNLNFLKIADLVSIPAIFALALGRIANFINGELVGRIYNGSWCVIFPNETSCRHPSTLYAAGKRFLITGWLIWLQLTKTFKPGFIFWNLIFWDGLGRIIVDFYRENTLYLNLSLGQWFSLVMVITSFYFFKKYYKDDWLKLLKNEPNSSNT
jgi:phosphatidylglycerol---prolipoprotein diacylglyceryl transferase